MLSKDHSDAADYLQSHHKHQFFSDERDHRTPNKVHNQII